MSERQLNTCLLAQNRRDISCPANTCDVLRSVDSIVEIKRRSLFISVSNNDAATTGYYTSRKFTGKYYPLFK